MGRSWTDFLRGSASAEHAVQIYAQLDELAESVAAYLAAGFEAGEPGVVVATPEHLVRFTELLADSGWDASTIEHRGLLVTADAEATLAAFMEDGGPSASAFERVVGGLLDGLTERFPGVQVRAFGEMVNLLSERGQMEAAVSLEELWNDLARSRDFKLLCGYRLNVFDRRSQVASLPDICRLHSHIQPAHDEARLARAVDLALEEVLGYSEAGKVYFLLSEEIRQERVPIAQLALMWVSANMPALADRILASARMHYFDGPTVRVSA